MTEQGLLGEWLMSRTRSYMFVLWADRFDESAATVFVTEFRIAGLHTKLVSLVSPVSGIRLWRSPVYPRPGLVPNLADGD